ncbi:MAG: hypothetical protein KVP17_002130 [Porospora cf. gigantea B]|uniref:uncharacterized protein n=1 Tax=Porospora cf. gigantea B TaxID=2853592 RepID=UPI003571B976|nr:MAG: hypothetical protein KVP17_002130 [Porospora cf. gigantea B]
MTGESFAVSDDPEQGDMRNTDLDVRDHLIMDCADKIKPEEATTTAAAFRGGRRDVASAGEHSQNAWRTDDDKKVYDAQLARCRITVNMPEDRRLEIQRARNRLSASKHRMRVKDTIEQLTRKCQEHERARIQAEVQMQFATRQAEKYRDENEQLRAKLSLQLLQALKAQAPPRS